MSDGFLNHLNHVVQAAQKEDGSSTTAAGHVVVLTKEADALPEEVKRITDPRKLNCQTPYFRCPAWATLPPTRFHLHCTRRGTDCSPLNLDRYAFYLFGKNRICDYILEHPSISAVHAALVFHGQQCCFVLVDLNSTNGVSINGKRVEKHKPMPLTVGSSLRFGFSERVYELRAGAPPAKRVREEGTSADASSSSRPKTMSREEVLANLPTQQHVSEPHLQPAIVAAAHTPAPASSPSPPDPPTALAAVDEALAALTSPSPPPPAVVEESIHLYQLVIKHKDLEKPISRGHNKGEAITRSLADALRLAQDILDAHARKTSTPSPTTARAPVRYMWSVEDFIEAVRNFCEATTFKKDGDLGIVERGNFSDDFDRAAFALRRGEVSPPVETPLGVHLLFRCD